MKLYGTPTSPYVRIVRVMLHETGLDSRVEWVPVRTRTPDCVVHAFNPTGKVPTLETDDGHYLSETQLVCEYLDRLHDGAPFAGAAPGLVERAYQGIVTGFADGVAVWVREKRRAHSEQSPGILQQERDRAERCLVYFERENKRLVDTANLATVMLAVNLALLDSVFDDIDISDQRPLLEAWYRRFAARPSMRATDITR